MVIITYLLNFADNITVSAPVKNGKDTALTWEMVLSKGVLK